MKSTRRFLVIGLTLLNLGFFVSPASALQGWRWADEGSFEITGTVREAKLDASKGRLKIDVEGEIWTIELARQGAGLKPGMIVPGVDVTVKGQRHDDPKVKYVKAEELAIHSRTINLSSIEK